MGEKLLDDFARALVQPMPRRHAVRLLGATLVATAFPGAALGRSRSPARRAVDCPIDGKQWKVCPVGDACCLASEDCCPPVENKINCCRDRSHCCANVCCDPAKYRCVKSNQGRNGKCVECQKAQQCRPRCCPKGSECCYRPSNAEPERPKELRGVCCKPPNVCRAGKCMCPNGKEACGGERCCTRKNEQCLLCSDCNEEGCKYRALKCCPGSKKAACCDGTCCPRSKPVCCGRQCCPAGTQCARSDKTKTLMCCPEKRVASRAGAAFCCHPGTTPDPNGECLADLNPRRVR